MAEALVSAVLQQLASVVYQKIENKFTMILNVKKDLQKLQSNLESIQAVLQDADRKQVRQADVRLWLEKLKFAAYDIDDVLDEWYTVVQRSQALRISADDGGDDNLGFSAVSKKKVWYLLITHSLRFHVIVRWRIARKIKELIEVLDAIVAEKNRYSLVQEGKGSDRQVVTSIHGVSQVIGRVTTSDFDELEVRGRITDRERIVRELLGWKSHEVSGLDIICIVGVGGIGKTTLAQLAYNENKVKSHFDKRVWVCVSTPFDARRIGNAIVEALDKSVGKFDDLEALLQHIKTITREKKLLIVLDDVWVEDYRLWEPLKNCFRFSAGGSKVLVTTRKERVVKMMGATYTHHLEGLTAPECWSLFHHIAFSGRSAEDQERLEKIGREIVGRCKGLPLAVKTLGNLLRLKETTEEWRNVLIDEIWHKEVVEDHLTPPLLLSYYDLSPAIKRCFSYCAIFPKDAEIDREELIRLWMAQGFLGLDKNSEMERKGNEYFLELATRSFFQDFQKDAFDNSITKFKMHDIVHDLAQYMTKNECFIMEVDGIKESEIDLSWRKSRHSALVLTGRSRFPQSLRAAKHIRTLMMSRVDSEIILSLSDLFLRFKYLRALNLSWHEISEVPLEVGKLKHLRYLNLSKNGYLVRLPETICDLYNLQSLELNGCFSLEGLPLGIGDLSNLRYLGIEGTKKIQGLPRGIGKLSNLRRLTYFIHGGYSKSADTSEKYKTFEPRCSLVDLKNLNRLEGQLKIYFKGEVYLREAVAANLVNKKDLRQLFLYFSRSHPYPADLEQVIDTLQPPPLLEYLEVDYYKGRVFPSWITLLENLRTLVLVEWEICESLPPLGKLPLLEELCIEYFPKVEKIGPEFLGVVGARNDLSFPKLKKLIMRGMEISEWKGIIMTEAEHETTITVMPCLRYFLIHFCPKLNEFPQFFLRVLQTAPLEELKIRRCPILESRCRVAGEDYWPKISHIPNISISYQYVKKDGNLIDYSLRDNEP